MYPVLLTVGPLTFYSYGLFLALAFFVGLYLFWRFLKEELIEEDEKILDFSTVVILVGLLSARIWYITFHFQDFGSDLGKIILFYRYPGFAFWGGMLGAVLAGLFWARRQNLNFYQYADFGVIGTSAGLILVQIGHFLAVNQKHPVALYEAVFYLAIFVLLWKLKDWRPNQRKPFAGAIFFLFLLFYSAGRLLVEPLKLEHTLWGSINIAYPFLGLLFAIAGFVLYTKFKRSVKEDMKLVMSYKLQVISLIGKNLPKLISYLLSFLAKTKEAIRDKIKR